jgi:hypothetical protein
MSETNAGFYIRTYPKNGKTVEQISFKCDRCKVSIVHFEDETKASVHCCGKLRTYQAPTKKTFLGALFAAEESLPRVKAVQPMVRVLENTSEEAFQ